ncbi:leucine-rich repeat domain-containing protein [Bifidobacterium moukalabense]|uniref:leucine-rich repeat domain-containing protein n=1 Tax=Bifidobacterium moukalabense TaxID=1333651 RepID=UPI0010FA6177|nr:leucine-rich repeat domain-containing protein [Bifidobacterium moukalabense]
MSILSEKQIKYGFDYHHKDEPHPKDIVEVSEYNGENALTINCTQLDGVSAVRYRTSKERRRVLQEWCDFLLRNTTAFTELSFGTRMPQELFDAVCAQRNLKKLYIKWGVYPDISKISDLEELECLHIGSGAGVQSIEPIAHLKNLVALSIENFQKINDYSLLNGLENLESLSIEGDSLSPQYIHVESLDFLHSMNQPRFFRFVTVRLRSKDYTPVLSLKNVEHLSLRPCKEVKELYSDIIGLPNLKYGLLIDRPELYVK